MSDPEEADMTPEQFKAALAELIAAATDDGVDPRGSWVYRADDPTETDWEVMIHELAGGSDD